MVTDAGAVLIDSGAICRSARQIHEAVGRGTDQPVKWVINTGGQDHRRLGNGYFQEQGAELVAHASERADTKMKPVLAGLRRTNGERLTVVDVDVQPRTTVTAQRACAITCRATEPSSQRAARPLWPRWPTTM